MASTDALPRPLRQRYPSKVSRDADDVDFLMEHLNDPNYDLKNSRPSLDYDEYNLSAGKKEYASSDIDNESQFGSDRYSTSRADSRNSTAIEFDECVLTYFCTYIGPDYHASESPYPEVRAAVASIDDPLMPVNTFRM
jgi:hypothetical protein